jgi:hypothetical protein
MDESRVVSGETRGDEESRRDPSGDAAGRKGGIGEKGDDGEIEEMSGGGGELEEKKVLGETGDEEIERSREELRSPPPTGESAREVAHGKERESGKDGASQLQPLDGSVE